MKWSWKGGNMQSGKFAFVLTLVALLLSQATLAFVTTPGNYAPLGVWKGDMYGVGAVTLDLQEQGGKLNGTILFYLIRDHGGKPPGAFLVTPEPLIDPTFDGKVLAFKVSHKNAPPPRTLNDPPVSFRLELINGNKARLTREGGEEQDSWCEM